MKRITKTLLGILIGVMLMGMTVSAAEYTVTDTDAVLWTNGSTVVQADASADAPVALPSMEIGTPVHITGVTSNGYWRVEIDGATYYIVGAGLGDTIVTDEYIRKYYDKPVITKPVGITIEVDYTEWNLITHAFKVAYTATNNTPYVIDIRTRARIYDGYTDETSSTNAHPLYDKEKEDINLLAPGVTASGYEEFRIENRFLEKNIVARNDVIFRVEKDEEVYGPSRDYIDYYPVAFYDYTTVMTRIDSPNEIQWKNCFNDL